MFRSTPFLARGNKENFKYVLSPNGDHALWESETGPIGGWPYVSQTVPNLHETIRRWLAERVGESA